MKSVKGKALSRACRQAGGKLITVIFLMWLFLLHPSPFTLHPVYAASPCDPTIPGDCPAGLDQIEQVFARFVSVAVGLGFVASLVMLVVTGIKYLTSGGEPKEVQQAHYTATWALLGILFFAIVWLILLLIQTFTGVDVTTFNIKALCGDATQGFPFCK